MSEKNIPNLFDFLIEKEEDVKENINSGNINFVDEIFEKEPIPSIFLPIEKKQKYLKDLKYYQTEELSSKVKKNYQTLFKNYMFVVCKGYEYLKSNLQKIVKDNNGFDVLLQRAKGEKLEKIGIIKKLSRERIRQIENNSSNEILIFIETYLNISFNKGLYKNILFYNLEDIFNFINDKQVIEVIRFVLLKKNKYLFAFYSDVFSTFINIEKKSALNTIINLIDLNDYFNYFERYSKINDTLIYRYNVLDFTFSTYKKFLINQNYIFKGNLALKPGTFSTNSIMSVFIKENYPKGIIIDEEGLKNLSKKMQEKYDYEFKLVSANAKIDELNPELIVWGKQKRIHIDNVHIKTEKLQTIITEFENHFENNSYMLLDDLYNILLPLLEGTVITDKYKLYGILKYHLHNKYYFKKMAVRKLEFKEYTLNELVYNYIDEHDLCDINDIVQELDIAVSSVQSILRDDISLVNINNKCTIANKIKISEDNLNRIKIKLEDAVCNQYIHRETFYSEYQDEWQKIGINDSSMLYNLCRYYYSDTYNFYIPYIQDKKYDYAITFKKIILDYFAKNNGIIDIEKAQKEIGLISATKDFSLIYQVRNNKIKVFRMAIDRMALLDNITIDDINTYQIKKRFKEFFQTNTYALEKDLEQLSKGLYYYVNGEKCYMNSYSLSSYIENYSKTYYVVNSLGINNYLTSKYAITLEPKTYQELIYQVVRKNFPEKVVNKYEVQKLIRDMKLLNSIPNGLLCDYGNYDNDKIIFND